MAIDEPNMNFCQNITKKQRMRWHAARFFLKSRVKKHAKKGEYRDYTAIFVQYCHI
jgi:hypothetical protein